MSNNILDFPPDRLLLKASQDDFRDLRVINEVKKRIEKIISQVTHTILVWPNCPFVEQLREAYKNSDDKIERHVSIMVNETIPENFIVCMNKDAEPIETLEIIFEDDEAKLHPDDIQFDAEEYTCFKCDDRSGCEDAWKSENIKGNCSVK